jgi:hypothetical protein
MRPILATPAWLFATLCWVTLAPPARGDAEATANYVSRTGLQFALPSALRPTAIPAELRSAGRPIDYYFSDGRNSPLQVVVASAPPPAELLLPDDSKVAREALARGVVAAQRPLLDSLTIDSVAVESYDPSRGAIVARLGLHGPSRARRLLDQPTDGPVWEEFRRQRIDEALLRCFLTQLLGAAPAVAPAQLEANQSSAAERCGVSDVRVARFVRAAGAANFAPEHLSSWIVAVFTRSATLTFHAVAAESRQPELKQLSASISSSVTVPWEERVQADAETSARIAGVALGAWLAISCLAGFVAWLATRLFKLSPVRAVSSALVLANVCLIASLVSYAGASATTWVKLSGYLLGSALLYRPLLRWLTRRDAPPRLWSDQRGLSTVEFAVVFILIVIGALALWSKLGAGVARDVGAGQTKFSNALGQAIASNGSPTRSVPSGSDAFAKPGASGRLSGPTADPPGMGHNGPLGNAAKATSAADGHTSAPPNTPPAAQGLFEQASESFKGSRAAQYAAGIAFGVVQGLAPGGFVAPSPYASSRMFELGRGLGQIGAGISETLAGLGMIGGGGAMTGAGALTTFTPVSPAGIAMVALGVPTATAGAVATTNGAISTAAGFRTFINAMSMSEGPPPSAPAPAAASGKAAPAKGSGPVEGASEALRSEQLGQKLGEGGNKQVFAVGEGKAVGILKPGKDPSGLKHEMELLNKLEQQGIPTVKARQVTVDGRPAVMFDRFQQGSKDVVRLVGDRVKSVGPSPMLNARSAADLRAIKQTMIDKKIRVDDLQFLIGKDGRIVVADPLNVRLGPGPSKNNLDMLNLLIRAAEGR